jgi:hypothetical protein
MTDQNGERGSVPGAHEFDPEPGLHEPVIGEVVTPVPDTRAIDRDALRHQPAPPTPSRGVPVSVRPVRAPITVVRQALGSTAALRASLAAKEAEANELRDSIDDLKRQLTIERSTDLPERRAGMPWWTLALVLAVVLFALLALLSYCTRPGATGVGAGPSAGATAAPTGPATAAVSNRATLPASAVATPAQPTAAASVATPAQPTATASVATSPSALAAPSVATTAMPWAGASVLVPDGVTASGPGVDADGSDVTYALDADGRSVDAYERLRVAVGIPQLTAQLTPLTALTPDLAAAKLGIAGLQVELDGRAVTPRQTAAGTWTASRPDGQPVTSAVLRYRLTGAVLRVEPARAGRRVALLTPLTARDAGTGQKVGVRVIGPGLVSLTCPLAPAAGVLCGTTSPTSATATLPPGLAPVAQLQFDRG